MPLTLGFMQVGLDLVTSANCKSPHWRRYAAEP